MDRKPPHRVRLYQRLSAPRKRFLKFGDFPGCNIAKKCPSEHLIFPGVLAAHFIQKTTPSTPDFSPGNTRISIVKFRQSKTTQETTQKTTQERESETASKIIAAIRANPKIGSFYLIFYRNKDLDFVEKMMYISTKYKGKKYERNSKKQHIS